MWIRGVKSQHVGGKCEHLDFGGRKKNMAPTRVDVRDQRRAPHEVSLETPESKREPERERIGVLFEGDYASKVREIDDFIKVETFCDEGEFLRVV